MEFQEHFSSNGDDLETSEQTPTIEDPLTGDDVPVHRTKTRRYRPCPECMTHPLDDEGRCWGCGHQQRP